MSRNRVTIFPSLLLKIRTVMGFIFSNPQSLEPSIAIENGFSTIDKIKADLKAGARDPLTMHAVFVLAAAYPLAILLSGNIVLKSGLRWSENANGMLCCIKALMTFTSALVTYKKRSYSIANQPATISIGICLLPFSSQ